MDTEKYWRLLAVSARGLLRSILVRIGRWGCRILFRITIEGIENVPRRHQGLLVISNHFSWFDARLISLLLPHSPAYLIATEAFDKWWNRPFTAIFESIPICRSQFDYRALIAAVRVMRQGGIVGIFPEGDIDPKLADAVAKGQQIEVLQGSMSRIDASLMRGKDGAVWLAIMGGVQILPVAVIGSQHIMDNLREWRRSPITLRIGPTFGPLTIETELKGAARRRQMEQFTAELMQHIVILLPPENHGYYEL